MKNLLYLLLLNVIICQTTGKISGTIIDGKSNEPIIGANVLIKDSYLGTASDINGDFYILNLNPGKYLFLYLYFLMPLQLLSQNLLHLLLYL